MDKVSQDCPFDPPHTHEYPSDWSFGGPTGTDPRCDPRFRPSIYTYLDRSFHSIHVTVTPICDDQALDEFTVVAEYAPNFNPVYLQVKHPNKKPDILPWQYDKKTDTLIPF